MRILFDQGTPVPLRQSLPHHEVTTAHEIGWSTLRNGELLESAGTQGFNVLDTTDMNLKYQQNLTGRQISIVVLSTPSWPRVRRAVEAVVRAIDSATPGGYLEVEIP